MTPSAEQKILAELSAIREMLATLLLLAPSASAGEESTAAIKAELALAQAQGKDLASYLKGRNKTPQKKNAAPGGVRRSTTRQEVSHRP